MKLVETANLVQRMAHGAKVGAGVDDRDGKGPAMECEVTVEVDAPLERVWAVLIDVERWPEWTESVNKVRRLDEGPMHAGSQVELHQPKMPPVTCEVTAIEADGEERRAFTLASGTAAVRTDGTYEVAARADGGAVVTLSMRARGPASAALAPLLGQVTQRYLDMMAEGLKTRAEGT